MKFPGPISVALIVLLIVAAANAASYASRPPFCDDNFAALCSTGGGPPVYARDTASGACTRYDNRCLFNTFNCMKYRSNQPREFKKIVNLPKPFFILLEFLLFFLVLREVGRC